MVYPIKGFLETSFSDWPGKVVAVIFLPYCNFRCHYCHNYELVLHPEKFPNYPWPEIVAKIIHNRDWIDGICITGGEPMLHHWLPSLIRSLRKVAGLNLQIKLDTNGSFPQVLEELIQEGLIDYVAMDFKAPLNIERYEKIVGIPLGEKGLANIQKSIDLLLTGKIDYEFRTTLVPTFLREEEVYEMAQKIKGAKRYTLQNFNPRQTLNKSLERLPPFDEAVRQSLQKKVNEIINGNDSLIICKISRGGQLPGAFIHSLRQN